MRDFTRPTKFNFENKQNLITAESSAVSYIRSDDGTLVDIHIAPTLNFANENLDTGEYILTIDPEGIAENRFKNFNQLTYSIGKLVRLAEMANDSLGLLVASYFNYNDFIEIISNKKYCSNLKYTEKPDISTLTFGNLRNIFSCILKSDVRFHTIEDLESKEKRGYITKLFDGYIVDRDYLTHGILFLKYPDFEPVVRVKIRGEEQSYLSITNQNLYDNLEIHKILMEVINKMQKIIDSFGEKRTDANTLSA